MTIFIHIRLALLSYWRDLSWGTESEGGKSEKIIRYQSIGASHNLTARWVWQRRGAKPNPAGEKTPSLSYSTHHFRRTSLCTQPPRNPSLTNIISCMQSLGWGWDDIFHYCSAPEKGKGLEMATTQDVGLLTRKLAAADYDPSRYVSEISQRCVGGEEVWPLNIFFTKPTLLWLRCSHRGKWFKASVMRQTTS